MSLCLFCLSASSSADLQIRKAILQVIHAGWKSDSTPEWLQHQESRNATLARTLTALSGLLLVFFTQEQPRRGP